MHKKVEFEEEKKINLYIYKVGAFFDLLGRTPPRPLAFEG